VPIKLQKESPDIRTPSRVTRRARQSALWMHLLHFEPVSVRRVAASANVISEASISDNNPVQVKSREIPGRIVVDNVESQHRDVNSGV
jgi:hypothetical protein